ncbi:hypothetical protein D9611_007303 [Ephemerocybe angulata]|uniref:BTB domain-containing protein n=1 Tax=Ephemerocybe angulata TaxID=980116 RepID=A0A8H5CF23_9AGAR|nr:hypothetical protein D9611_007303 [Tulosesus angulatus]
MPKRRTRHEDTKDDDLICGASALGEHPPKRCEDVWFDDGNVVLQAEDIQFKVHKSVLAKHSSVFADLFDMPHANDEPKVDGCPIVELHDSAEDIKHMSLRLYGLDSWKTRDRTARGDLPMALVRAIIRMGRKYDIEHIRDEGLELLKKAFPTELSGWENITQSPHKFECQTRICRCVFELALEAIKLAHESDIKTILPACYLVICCYRDGKHTHMIPAEVRALCAFGGEEILDGRNSTVYSWLADLGETEKCTNSPRCLRLGREFMKDVWQYPSLLTTFWDWRYIALLYGHRMDDLCVPCLRGAERSHQEKRREVWGKLPGYFGLPGWGELKDFEN